MIDIVPLKSLSIHPILIANTLDETQGSRPMVLHRIWTSLFSTTILLVQLMTPVLVIAANMESEFPCKNSHYFIGHFELFDPSVFVNVAQLL